MKCPDGDAVHVDDRVAPFTGAWIEIYRLRCADSPYSVVAPFTGAWIEMRIEGIAYKRPAVAPFTGAWIEIFLLSPFVDAAVLSHPSRVRGLK